MANPYKLALFGDHIMKKGMVLERSEDSVSRGIVPALPQTVTTTAEDGSTSETEQSYYKVDLDLVELNDWIINKTQCDKTLIVVSLDLWGKEVKETDRKNNFLVLPIEREGCDKIKSDICHVIPDFVSKGQSAAMLTAGSIMRNGTMYEVGEEEKTIRQFNLAKSRF